LSDVEADFDRQALAKHLALLAGRGVFVGTSSWKYAGWLGTVYEHDRYLYRGKFSKRRFEAECLAEYAETFRTVCVDAAYYTFPTAQGLSALSSQVPPDFRFGFKVTDLITLRRFPNLPRFGARKGMSNEHFLDAGLFADRFLAPCEAIRGQVGIVMFEFSRFSRSDYAEGGGFLAELDSFLAKLPAGWPYGVELRNSEWLGPEYFACLARHGVSPVYSAWTEMPAVTRQMDLDANRSEANLLAGRFLLAPGATYAQSIADYEPFDRLQRTDEDARSAVQRLVEETLSVPGRRAYLFINNRLEGSAPRTIAAIVNRLPATLRVP
jgi:uncharacterized protein YecE (DUF72 family)